MKSLNDNTAALNKALSAEAAKSAGASNYAGTAAATVGSIPDTTTPIAVIRKYVAEQEALLKKTEDLQEKLYNAQKQGKISQFDLGRYSRGAKAYVNPQTGSVTVLDADEPIDVHKKMITPITNGGYGYLPLDTFKGGNK